MTQRDYCNCNGLHIFACVILCVSVVQHKSCIMQQKYEAVSSGNVCTKYIYIYEHTARKSLHKREDLCAERTEPPHLIFQLKGEAACGISFDMQCYEKMRPQERNRKSRIFDACVRSQLAYPFFFCLLNFCQQKSLVHLSCALRTPLQVHQPNMNENHSVYGHVFSACHISCATPFLQRITIGLAHIELFPQLQLKVDGCVPSTRNKPNVTCSDALCKCT